MKRSTRTPDNDGSTTEQPPRQTPGLLGWLLFGGLTVGGLALDLWSKQAVFDWLARLEGHEYVLIDGFLRFIPRVNTGAAFSIAEGQRTFLVAVSLAAFIVVTVLFAVGHIHRRLMQIALGLMNAGILGNLYDRMFNDGKVRDFIDVSIGSYSWPTFNVADSLLCVGVGLMLILSFTSGADQKPARPQTAERPSPPTAR